jgi:hypothetical protein
MSSAVPDGIRQSIEAAFANASIPIHDLEYRAYPDESNVIAYVDAGSLGRAAEVGNGLDEEFAQAGRRTFVVVRKSSAATSFPVEVNRNADGVQGSRASDFIRLISSRSRVSLVQPSLSYVHDAQTNLSSVTAARHHLIFGRRGAGKTALLVEAMEQLKREGEITSWVNVQTLRHESPGRVVLYVLDEVLSSLQSAQQHVRPESIVALNLIDAYDNVQRMLSAGEASIQKVSSLIPVVQRALHRFLDLEGVALYIFLDDFYYLPRSLQPQVLDVLHGCVRDSDAWLKIASIRHLTRWFQSSPPVGLQTGHDADLIDLDVTLQDPGRAKEFLESVLQRYAEHVGIQSLNRVFNNNALDRLVIASGAVPRDYLVLASSALGKARSRQNATSVGATDVNQAAGDAAGVKLQELEEDMASDVGTAEQTLSALRVVREFCLEENAFSYFLVSFRNKEEFPQEYSLLTDLMDVRLIHLLDSGVSDAHSAGHRLEAYMLDLSQYSGSRLKQRIRILDLEKGRMISRETRSREAPRVGGSPLQVISILRAAPVLPLERLTPIIESAAGRGRHAGGGAGEG